MRALSSCSITQTSCTSRARWTSYASHTRGLPLPATSCKVPPQSVGLCGTQVQSLVQMLRPALARGHGARASPRARLVVMASEEEDEVFINAYDGCQMAVHYIGKAAETGITTQTTWDRQEGPLIYTLGSMQGQTAETASARIMQRMDIALLGMKEGDIKTFSMSPAEAYGEADPDLVMDIPMAAVKQAMGVAADSLILGTNIMLPDGRKAVVKSVSDLVVNVDLNHPLAGVDMEFELVVMEVAEPGQLMEAQKDMKIATVSHILVDEELKCKLLMEAIAEGADFAAVATDNSTCPSAVEGGKLGTFQQGMMVPEFDKVVFDSETEVGVVTGPVKTQFGYHLIRVEDRMIPS